MSDEFTEDDLNRSKEAAAILSNTNSSRPASNRKRQKAFEKRNENGSRDSSSSSSLSRDSGRAEFIRNGDIK